MNGVKIMMININIDSDDEGKIQLAVQGHIIPDWVYANSQIEHENKRIRLLRQHQQLLEREAKQKLQQKRQRLQREQKQKQKLINEVKENKINHQHVSHKNLVDDGPDL